MPSKLEIVLSVLSEGMEAFTKTGDRVDDLKKKSEGLTKANTGLTSSIVGILAPLATAATAIAAFHSAMELGDSIRNQSDALSISTKAVQEWNYAAKQSGGSAEAVTNSFGKLTKNIYEAQTGNKELAATFKVWNIDLVDTNGNLRDVESITNDTMRAISGIKDPIERAGVATELLGKGSKDLLPLLAGGTEAMDAQRKAAGDLGQVLSESAIKTLDDVGDSIDTFKTAMKVASAETVSVFVPTLEKLATVAAKTAIAVRKMIAPTDDEMFARSIEKANAQIARAQAMLERYKNQNAPADIIEVWEKQVAKLQREDSVNKGLSKLTKESMASATVKTEDPALRKAQQEAAEKADKKKIKDAKALHAGLYQIQQDFNRDEESSFKDAEKSWKETQKNKFQIQADFDGDEKQSFKDAEKAYEESQKRNKSLDSNINKAELANEKDKSKRRKTELRQEKEDIEKNYKEQLKEADGSASEIIKINKLKNLSMQAAEKSYSDWQKANAKEGARNTVDTLTGMLQQAGAKHKEAAIAYKTLSIGMTVIDTIKGAQSSYNALASIPIFGPVLGAAAAIIATTAGLVRVNEIRKQNFASGSSGVTENTWARVGEMGPENIYLPKGSQVENHHKTTQQINNNQKKSTTLIVNLQNSDGSVSKKFERELRNGSMDYVARQLKKKMQVT